MDKMKKAKQKNMALPQYEASFIEKELVPDKYGFTKQQYTEWAEGKQAGTDICLSFGGLDYINARSNKSHKIYYQQATQSSSSTYCSATIFICVSSSKCQC